MTFYNPLGFIFLITIPLIILLYLLKQRHQDQTVSSLYLWNEVIRDLEANAPWQKLRKNILMFLQILAMALLVLALAKPFLNSASSKSSNIIIAIDSSLSMQATDIAPSRFDAAKKQAVDIVSNIKPGTQVTLMTMAGSPVIIENMSMDRGSLINRIKQLEPSNGIANHEEASTLIQSIVRQYPGTEVYIIGDTDIAIPNINVKNYNISKNGDNFAITLLSNAISQNGITALSCVSNFSSKQAIIPISLYVNGKVFDAKDVEAKPGETINVYWNSIPQATQFIECRIDVKDSLEADNRAWDSVNAAKMSKTLLVSEKNIFIEKALSVINGIKLYKTNTKGENDFNGYDLYIFDGFVPEKLPADGNIMILNPPQNSFFTVTGTISLPFVEKSKHELFSYITDFSFSIAEMKKMEIPKWAIPVLESKEGPIIFSGELDNRRILVFGFDLHHSDLPLTSSFPILISNSMEWLIPSSIKNTENIYSGQSIEFNLDPKAEEVMVKSPAGKLIKLAPPFPAEIFDDTNELGLYTLEQKTPSSKLVHNFSVNAPAEQESNLKLTQVNTHNVISEGKNSIPVNMGHNLQTILLWFVLLLITIEWWVYKNDV